MGTSLCELPVAQSPLKKHPVSQRGALGKICMNYFRIKYDDAKIAKIYESTIISFGKMPAPGPAGDGPFRSVCVRSE